jgi:hypothetical protein
VHPASSMPKALSRKFSGILGIEISTKLQLKTFFDFFLQLYDYSNILVEKYPPRGADMPIPYAHVKLEFYVE